MARLKFLNVPLRPHTLFAFLAFWTTFGLLLFLSFIKIRSRPCTPASFNSIPTPKFFSTDNGLLVFASPIHNRTKSINPIEALIINARKEWNSVLRRQSSNLLMAVQEYQRRHNGRLPPKGFEKWWQFAVDNRVALVDEYDQISQDLEPFWAIEPATLRKLVDELKTKDNSRRLIFQVGSNGWVNRTGAFGNTGRAKDLSRLMESYQKYSFNATNDFTIVVGADDQAEVRTTWREKSTLVELSRRGQLISEEENLQLAQPRSLSDDCPPESSPRTLGIGYSSFIYDHLQSMEICSSLEQVPIHGSLMNRWNSGFKPITPLFSFSKTMLDSDIRVTPLEQYLSTYPGTVYSWEDPRRVGKAFWRGSTTGSLHSNENPTWKQSHRMRLHEVSRPKNEFKLLIDGTQVNLAEVNPEWFDVEFVGEPIQCEPPVCDEMKKMIHFHDWIDYNQANLYKYVLDVDGNGWSGRFHRLLSSNRVVIKNTIFPEWYADRIQPWYHYIPAKTDYSDLHDIIYFLKKRDDLAQEIARNGREYSQKYWRKEDMAAYMFRLSLEWSRLYNREICNANSRLQCDSYDFNMDLLRA